MKRTLTILILTAAIFGFGGYNLYRLHHAKSNAIDELDRATVCIENKEYIKASEIADSIFESWKEDERVLRLFTRRNYVDEAADILSELPALAEQKNISVFIATAEKAQNIIEHIWENEIPSLDTLLFVRVFK